MAGIDEAAAAFDADMGGKSLAPATVKSSTGGDLDVTDIFPQRTKEVDDNSPAVAAGDLADEAAAKTEGRRTKKVEKANGADEEEDPLYSDLDSEPGPKDDEDEEEEDEDDEDDEDDEEDGEEEDGGEPVDLDPDLVVTVKIDGEDKEVTLGEALDGYTRTQTFHQRMNEVNEVKQQLSVEGEQLYQDRKKAIELLGQLEDEVQSVMPEEPDWDDLFAKAGEDPTELKKVRGLQKGFETFKANLDAIRQRRAEAIQVFQQEQAKKITTFATEQRERFDSMPENRHWKSDPRKRDRDLQSMVRTARSVGFTDDEIRGTLDHRMLAILLRASKYDRMTANRPKLAPTGKKPAKPGAGNGSGQGRSRTAQRGFARSQQQLAKTGSVEAAADVFSHILSRG